MQKRTSRFHMRLTETERAETRKAAAAIGISETRLVKNAVNLYLTGFQDAQHRRAACELTIPRMPG